MDRFVGEEQVFSFGHVEFEMYVRQPSGNFEINLEFGRKVLD